MFVIRAARRHVLVLVLIGTTAPAAAQSTAPRYDPAWHAGIAAASVMGAGLIKWFDRGDVPRCKWCGVDDAGHQSAPGLDVWARRQWRWSNEARASTLSHVTAGASYAWPLIGLVAASGGGARGRDLTAVLSALGVAQFGADWAKRGFARARPEVVFDGAPMDAPDDVHSFFSGHSATAFAAVVSIGTIASRRDSRHAPWIWAGGLSLAGSTGYLRVAADRHFLTDVLVGVSVGTAAGLLLPRLFDEDGTSPNLMADGRTPVMVGVGPAARLTHGARTVGFQLGTGAGTVGILASLRLP